MFQEKRRVIVIVITALAAGLLLLGGVFFLETHKGDRGVYLTYYSNKGAQVCDIEKVIDYFQELDDTAKEEKEREASLEARRALIEQIEEQELPGSIELDIPELFQKPELPTGCESVALTILLLYDGYSLEKTTIADDYLIISDSGKFHDGYIGNPRSQGGAGCFPETLAATGDLYLQDQGAQERAEDLTGKEFESLLHYVAAGYPVVVWNTMYMMEPSIDLRGKDTDDYTWYEEEHCVVLAGYDRDRGTVLVSDPLEGIVERNLQRFAAIYEKTGQYAMTIL